MLDLLEEVASSELTKEGFVVVYGELAEVLGEEVEVGVEIRLSAHF